MGNKWRVNDVGPGVTGFLYGIACAPTDCSVVGEEYVQGNYSAVTVQGTGLGPWSISSTNPAPPSNGLDGVSCTSATDCMAVGYNDYYVEPPVTIDTEPLVESWDGSSWTSLPTSSSGTQSSLSGVSCDSPSDCMAVGTTNAVGGASGLIEHWDGSTWSIVSTPPLVSLNAVSCVDSADCTAVGAGSEIAHWDGTAWSVEPSPTPARSTSSVLNGVSCTSASNCMAVGSYVKRSSAQADLAELWNGTVWSIVRISDR